MTGDLKPLDFQAIADKLSGLVPNDPPEPIPDPAADRDRRLATMARAGIPKRVREALLQPLTPTKALQAAQDFAGGLLVLSGQSGCGKTIAACHWLEKRLLGPPPPRLFWTAFDLERISRYDPAVVTGIVNCRSLVLDDLGVEYLDAKGHFVSLLDGILGARHAEERSTVMATNLDAKEFKESYGARIAGRIREAGRFVSLNEPCLRKQKRDAELAAKGGK